MPHDESSRSSGEHFVWWTRGIGLLAALLPTLAAWDYGGILPWTKWCVAIATAALLVAVLPTMVGRLPSSRWAYAMPALGLAVWLLGVGQALPLPAGVVAWLSPGAHEAYGVAEDLLNVNAGDNGRMESISISIEPASTRSYLVLPACFAAFVFVATIVYRSAADVQVLLVTAAVSGAAISYLGIADKISVHESSGRLVSPADAALPFGPYVNRNNAAGYLNLCLACCVGALVYRHRHRLNTRKSDPRYQINAKTSKAILAARVRRFFLLADNLSLFYLGLAILIAAGIFISGSRGGMLAAGCGSAVVAIRSLNRSRKFTAVATLSIGFILLGFALGSIGMLETVQERFAQAWGDEALQDGRLGHWQDSVQASLHYLPAGAGLGTYRFAYLPYQHHGGSAWFVNADGMPFEWLLEGGIPMVAILIAGVLLVYRLLWQLAYYKSSSSTAAVTAMAWFAVPALLVSQTFDFGITLPANLLLTALIFGSVCAAIKPVRPPRRSRPKEDASQSSHHVSKKSSGSERQYNEGSTKSPVKVVRHADSGRGERRRTRRRGKDYAFAAACWAGCLIAVGFAVEQQFEAAEIDRLERAMRAWKPEQIDAQLAIDEIVVQTTQTLKRFPDHPRLLKTHCDALMAQSQVVAALPRASSTTGRRAFERLLQATHPIAQRFEYHSLRGASEATQVDWRSVLLPGQSEADFSAARHSAQEAFRVSPLNDKVLLSLITLDFVEGQFERTAAMVQRLRKLKQRDPNTLQRLAVLASAYPGIDVALDVWRHELKLAPERLALVWQTIQKLDMEVELTSVVPDDLAALLLAAEQLTNDAEVRTQLLDRIDGLIDRKGRAALMQASLTTNSARDAAGDDEDDATVPLRRYVADDSQWHYFNARIAVLRENFELAEANTGKRYK
ncbi:MAG: O-antigen ligase family protein [Pirellulaceae bacterium]